MNFDAAITNLKGVGPKKAEILAKNGIYSVGDLLQFFPRKYIDYSNTYNISNAPLNENICIKAFVGSAVREHIIRKGMSTYTITVTDGFSFMDITFFNNKYISAMINKGEEYIFYGKIVIFNGRRSMNSPKFLKYIPDENGLKPIYHQSADLNSNAVEKMIKTAFEEVDCFDDCLPENIRNDYCLMNFHDAVKNIHFPKNVDLLSEARRRLAFEELFLLQLGLAGLKNKSRKATSVVIQQDYTLQFFKLLPFELTGAQKRAVSDCINDMSSGLPMSRLIQGDVGSGKTAVSAAVIYNCVKNGFQAAMMAPTEVLATQHFHTLTRFFDGTGISVELLTGSTTAKKKNEIKSKLSSGDLNVIIGTHAIIQKDVIFNNLGLAITDEQHRFGVNQRGMLTAKGDNPHVMVMSATPIPRTLALIIYGDLDLSILDELPAGRQKIDTFLIDTSIRYRAYNYVKKHLIEGRQGYIVCPLVDKDDDEDESSNVKTASVQLYNELLTGFFKGFKLGLLYGKMKPDEKSDIMSRFSSGEIDLLISTTVIEVGVDVPNAVIMIIENADNFGLSQLHQLRGRVGRGNVKSTCILISDNKETSERLKIMTSTNDGFKIADEDLKLRGPGDFIGQRQHGLPDLKSGSLMSDSELVRETHSAAENLIKNNPTLEGEEFKLLKNRVNQMFSKGITLN